MLTKIRWAFLFLLLMVSTLHGNEKGAHPESLLTENVGRNPYIVVLGIAQDGGYPHAGCTKECCKNAWTNPDLRRFVSCLALIDPETNERWMFDATPDFPYQLHLLDSIAPVSPYAVPQLFLTHAHIGHYTGLMYLGREAMGTKSVKVYAMPEMTAFLNNNGPWNQLVKLQNIELVALHADAAIAINRKIIVTPFLVPHRHEYSETVGYRIATANKKVIYIPDIDKWEKWGTDITEVVKQNDVIFIDGTFFKEGEISGRSMSEIPHPFIEESMKRFETLPALDKAKIYFIHLNHTNPALTEGGDAQKEIISKGFHVAGQKQVFTL